MHLTPKEQESNRFQFLITATRKRVPQTFLEILRDDLQSENISLNFRIQERKIGLNQILEESEKLLNDNKLNGMTQLISRLGATMRLTFKNPKLTWNLLFSTFQVEIQVSTAKAGMFNSFQEYAWWGATGVKFGMPVSFDSHDHGLALFREDRFQVYLYGFNGKVAFNTHDAIPILENPEEVLHVVSNWNETRFLVGRDIEIRNGDALIKGNSVIPLIDNFQVKFQRNSRVFSTTWISVNNSTPKISILNPWRPLEKVDGNSLFIEGDNNFYHFISEGLRPLLYAIENGLRIDNILVRESLPESFYMMIADLAPTTNLIKLPQGSSIILENLLFCILGESFSSKDSNFGHLDGGKAFSESDEFKSWRILRASLIEKSNSVQDKKMSYICRPLNQSRGIIFENRIKKIIKQFGGSIIEMDQANSNNYFQGIMNSQVLITSDGAGVANIALLNEGSLLIELGGDQPGWKNLADALNLDYRFLKCWNAIPSVLRRKLDFSIYKKSSLRNVLTGLPVNKVN